MFFQETTPDTSGYMIAGYVITFVIMGLYVASLYLRNRNYKQDIALLKEMDKPALKVEEQPAAAAAKRTSQSGIKKRRK